MVGTIGRQVAAYPKVRRVPNPSGGFFTIFAGQTDIFDWTVGLHSVDYIGDYWEALEGERSVDLNGHRTGEISQTLATTPGITYQVSFDMSG